MPKTRHSLVAVLAPLVATASLAACGDVDPAVPSSRNAPLPTAPQAATAAATALPGRALAANCFQCHGTDGYASELKIAGESRSEIVSELNEMRAEDPRRNIMNVHAAAYTPAEITLISDYFAAQGK